MGRKLIIHNLGPKLFIPPIEFPYVGCHPTQGLAKRLSLWVSSNPTRNKMDLDIYHRSGTY